jgi:oligoribonuclease
VGKKFICLDLEMTGLLESDEILEVACIVIDESFNEVSDGFSKVVSSTADKLENMMDVCKNMHKESGLWDDVLLSENTIAQVELSLLEFVTNHTSAHDELILCGNSIHVDRGFIKRYMSSFDHILHYRMLDVTSVGLFLQASGVVFTPYVKAKAHRALDDIKESIGEMLHYQSILK